MMLGESGALAMAVVIVAQRAASSAGAAR